MKNLKDNLAVVVVTALLLLAFVGWDAGVGPFAPMFEKPAPKVEKVSQPVAKEQFRHVSRAEFESAGHEWPLTVDHGTIECRNHRAAFVDPTGRRWALNGTAQKYLPKIEPIWRENPVIPGTRVNLGQLTSAAVELCD